MDRAVRSKVVACLVATFAAYSTIPGCVIRFGPIEEDQTPDDGTETGTTGGGPLDPGSEELTPEQEREQFLANVDPYEHALLTTKAGFAAAYAVGQVESLGLDPATVDEATLDELMAYYMPLAAVEAETWVATLDPEVIAQGIVVDYECGSAAIGCEMVTYCKGGYTPPVAHQCHVTSCGDAGCPLCPSWVADYLKHIIYKRWCAYVCAQHPSNPVKIVAWGVGFIPMLGGPKLAGPYCFEQSVAP